VARVLPYLPREVPFDDAGEIRRETILRRYWT